MAAAMIKRDVVTLSEITSLTVVPKHFRTLRALAASGENSIDHDFAKTVQENEFMDLFSANQTGMGASPYSFGLARLFPFLRW